MKNPKIFSVLAFSFFLSSALFSNADSEPCHSEMHGVYKIEKKYDEASATWYFLTEIKNQDADGKRIKLRHAHSNQPLGETVKTFAERICSPLAFNASTATLATDSDGEKTRKPRGTQIIDGEIIQELPANRYILGIKADNELVAYRPGTPAQEMLEDRTVNALTAFIPLIEDHEPVPDEMFATGPRNYREKHPRQIIAQMDNLDLIFLSCGGRGYGGEGMSPQDVIRILLERGAKFAYMLDGGGSVTTVVNGKLITEKIDRRGTEERKRPNFLYILEK